MSIQATEVVWTSSEAQRGSLLVMLALAREADETGIATLTLERIAKLTRLSTRAVTNCVSELSQNGELSYRRGIGRGNPNQYAILLGELAERSKSDGPGPDDSLTREGEAGSRFQEPASQSEKSATESRKTVPENVEVSSSRARVVNTPVGSINNSPSKPASSRQESPKQKPVVAVPEGSRELVDAMTAAGMLVGWRLKDDEWARVTALSARWGTQQLVDIVARRWDHGRPPQSARYLLRIWDDLPSHDSAAHPGNVVPLRRSGSWHTYRNETTPSAYQNGF